MSVITAATAAGLGSCPFEVHIRASATEIAIIPGVDLDGDTDLVLHCAVCRAHALAVYGPPAAEVFGPVPADRVGAAMVSELQWALEHANTTYAILNACRALRFADDGQPCSKLDGGHWYLARHGANAVVAAAIAHNVTAVRDRRRPQPPRSWRMHVADWGSLDLRHLIWIAGLSVVVSIVQRLVPDELWERFQRVVPEAPSRPQGGGRRRHGDREVPAAIVFVATSGCTWQQLPAASFGPSGATAHRRFAEWSKARVWAKLHRLVLDELGSRGDLDWSRCAIDSVYMRALKKGDLTGPNPVDRGKYGSKIHLITERTGLPISVGISGANVHDSQALIPLVKGVPSIRSRRGLAAASPASSTPTRATTTATCGNGSPAEASDTVSPAKASRPHSASADIAGPSNAPWPGLRDAADSTAATNARPNTSSPSPASPAPSSATADSPNAMAY